MRSLRPVAATVFVAIAMLAFPSGASARPCVSDVCVPPSHPEVLDPFCAIADGPLVEIICSLG